LSVSMAEGAEAMSPTRRSNYARSPGITRLAFDTIQAGGGGGKPDTTTDSTTITNKENRISLNGASYSMDEVVSQVSCA
jgi:hypothetical protein